MRFSIPLAVGIILTALNSQAQDNVHVTGNLTYQQGAAGVYDYTLTLSNAGPESVSSLWLGWTVGVFDIAHPTAASDSLGWTASAVDNSIQYGAGTALVEGSTATFSFDSTSTPAQFMSGAAGASVVYGIHASPFAIENTTADSEEFTPTLTSTSASNTNLAILVQPQSKTVPTNTTVTFTVVATNATSYQWQSNSVAIAGQTGDSLTIGNVVASDAATYTVVVSDASTSITSSNAVLTVTSPGSASLAGAYSGLFWDTNDLSNASSGGFSATVTGKGVIDGNVKIAGVTTSFAGLLAANGSATITLPHAKPDGLVLTLQFDLSGSGALTGTVADANHTFNARLIANRAAFSAASRATAYEGSYTWAMPAIAGVAPAGNSFGAATIAPNGSVRLSIFLGDGTTASASGALARNGLLPLHVSANKGQGSFLAWLSFNKSGVSTNAAFWFKDATTMFKLDSSGNPIPVKVAAGEFPNGFTLTNLWLYTAPYTAPAKGNKALSIGDIAIQLSGADLSNSVIANLPLNSGGVGAAEGIAVSASSGTGLFSGSFRDGAAKVQFHGAVLQGWQAGFGAFVGGGLNGAVVIEPTSAQLPAPVENVQTSPEFNQNGNILIADQWNNRVVEVTTSGRIIWSFGLGPTDFSTNSPISVNDAERVGDYTLMANPGDAPGVIPQTPDGSADNRVMLVDPVGNVVWQYGQFGQSGEGPDLLNVPVQATFVPPFNVLITDQANNRIIEVNYNKDIVWQYPGTDTNAADQLNGPNAVEMLANGDVLISDQGNNRAIEVSNAGEIVKTFSAGGTVNIMAFASRLPNGDTLLTDGANARIVEVNAEDKVVWQYYTTNNAPHAPAGSASVASPQPTRAVRLANGNTLISDQLNNRVFEVTHAGKIVADYGLPLPLDGGTFSGGSAGILIGINFGFGLDSTQQGMYSPYDAKVIGDYTGLTPPLATPAKAPAAIQTQGGY